MKKKLQIYLTQAILLILVAAVFLLTGCNSQTQPTSDEPDDVIVREEPGPSSEELPVSEDPSEEEINEVSTVERFSEATEMKEMIGAYLEGDFETINTGLGIVDRADIGTGSVEVAHFENGLLRSVTFFIPYDLDAPENALEELSVYIALLKGNELDEEEDGALREAVVACVDVQGIEPTELTLDEMMLFLNYDYENSVVSISR